MEFTYDVYWVWHVFGHDILITETHFNTWVIGAVLIAFALFVRMKLKSFTDVPKTKLQVVIEGAVEAIDGLVRSNMGEKYAYFGTWFFGVFAYIMVANLSGLLGMRPPTADLTTTAALGATTFIIIHVMGIRVQKGKYFKEYLSPVPIFLPTNIVSELAIPVSLSFRLFGNILGGFFVMGLLYGMFPTFLTILVPAPLHFYFDVFAGCLQAFVFTMLSIIFINKKLVMEN